MFLAVRQLVGKIEIMTLSKAANATQEGSLKLIRSAE